MRGRTLREWKRRTRRALGMRNTLGDAIKIEDEVLVWQGDKLLFRSRGHIVNQGLIGIVNLMVVTTLSTVAIVPSRYWSGLGDGYMYVGTGTGVTTGGMTNLVSPVATKPNSQSGATSVPATGTYRVAWTGTWNAGTLAAINVSELGMWLYIQPSLQSFGATGMTGAVTFFSRLSDSDGDFTTFTVNTAVPLTVEWRLTFTFA